MLFWLAVHHADVFAYEYYRDGKRIDQYGSRPDGGDRPAAFASELLVALGMVNVETSYEYLSDVEEWDQFVHVPDLRTEPPRTQKADEAHQVDAGHLV